MTPDTFLLVNGSVTGLLWMATGFFIRAQLVNSKGNQDITYAAQFVFFFALAVTFTMRWVYELVDSWVSFNNLAWLLSYLSLATALHSGALVSYSMDKRPMPEWPKVLFGFTVAALVLFYIVDIAPSPSYADHALARSPFELVFMTILFSYAAVIGSIPMRLFKGFANREARLHLSLRASLIAAAAGAGVTCMTLKAIYTIVGYFIPGLWLLNPLWLVMWTSFMASGAFLLLACLPLTVFKRAASRIEWGRSLWLVYELQGLRKRLERYCPPVATIPTSWRTMAEDPSYHLYRTLIYLFDCQPLLLQSQGQFEARVLHSSLQQLPVRDGSFENHIVHARRINWEVQRQMRAENADRLTYRLAQWLSRIIHPFTLVVPTLIGAAWLSGVPLQEAVGWVLLAIPIAILPLVLYMAVHLRRGQLSDWDVSLRQQRKSVYGVGIASIFALLLIYIQFDAPRVLQACLLAAITAYGIGAVINQRLTKISIHATAAAGAASVIAYFSPRLAVFMVIAVLAGGWSRVYLKRHTALQVILGWIIAIISVALIFPFFLSADG